MTRPSRRRRDTAVAAGLAVVAVVLGLVIYFKSDARATALTTGPDLTPPAAMGAIPSSLQIAWTLSSSARFPAVVSPYGTVVTADDHTVTGYDGVTGAFRWSYGRSNVTLCAVGSGDTGAPDFAGSGAVRGIVTGFVKSGRCSEITTLDPTTGERGKQRTGFTGADSRLIFGGPYGGMISNDLVELWRYDLVRTIQYGNQPEPTKPNTKHLGCEFADIALAGTQFGTIEHCAASGSAAQLMLNYDDPGSTTDGRAKSWDALNFAARATVNLGSDHARLLSMSAEEAAVLVASPTPAVVVYDATGKEVSRVPIGVSADQIVAADAGGPVTPVVFGATARYLLVGSTLIAVNNDGLGVLWTLPDVLGKPALVGSQLLVPVAGGLAVVPVSSGSISSRLRVDRAGYIGRIDVGTVGNSVVETRGTAVVGLRDPAAPSTDPPSRSASSTAPTTGGIRLPLLTPSGSPSAPAIGSSSVSATGSGTVSATGSGTFSDGGSALSSNGG